MEIYKNDYTRDEDEMLWEIHEIRRQLHKDLRNKSIDQINEEALSRYSSWKRQNDNGMSLTVQKT